AKLKGGGGRWLTAFRVTRVTMPPRLSQASFTSSAARFVGPTGGEEYLASKTPSPFLTLPLAVQYGVGTNVLMSTSFSTTKFNVGPCTRPMLTVLNPWPVRRDSERARERF